MKQIVTDLVSLVWCGAAAASSGCWLPPSGDGGFQGLFPSGEPLNTCRCLHKETCCPRGKKIGPSYPCSLPCGPINILALTNPVSSRSGGGGTALPHTHEGVHTLRECSLDCTCHGQGKSCPGLCRVEPQAPPLQQCPFAVLGPATGGGSLAGEGATSVGKPVESARLGHLQRPQTEEQSSCQQPAGVSVSGQQCCGRG